MKIAVGNAQHIGDRQEQQDSFGFSDPANETFAAHGGFLGVVADGMGGLANGSEASHAAVRTFLRTYESKAPTEPIPEALARSMVAANQEVVALAEQVGSRNGTGTTLAAAVLHGGSLHWISAGDSRVYLCHGNSLIRVTSDHVYARQLNEEVATGRISRAEAEENVERAALTSFLGDLKDVDRSLRPFLLSQGDRVFLCSDGLYRALSDTEITAALHDDPQTACDTLVEQVLAKQRKHQDNLTILALAPAEASAEAHRWWSKRTLAIAGLLILAAIGAGSYYAWRSRHPAAPTSTPQVTGTATAPAAAGASAATPAPAGAATQAPSAGIPAGGSAPQPQSSGKGTGSAKDNSNKEKTTTPAGKGGGVTGGQGSKPKSDDKGQGQVKRSPTQPGSSVAIPPTSAQSPGGQGGSSSGTASGTANGPGTPASTASAPGSEPKPPASGQTQDAQPTTDTQPPPTSDTGGLAPTTSTPPPADAGTSQSPPAENNTSSPPPVPQLFG